MVLRVLNSRFTWVVSVSHMNVETSYYNRNLKMLAEYGYCYISLLNELSTYKEANYSKHS